MSFLDFLYEKYPLYRGKELSEFHITVEQMVKLVEEWLTKKS